MFTNYESGAVNQICEPDFQPEPQKGPKIVTNIKGEAIGVQIEHMSPLHLYFHLENFGDIELDEFLQGKTLFEILTTTHKSVITREYPTAEILNQYTNDLFITLSQTEVQTLKKETYNMRVTLKTDDADYQVFAEKDGYLIVR
jgi:hypothetical protein